MIHFVLLVGLAGAYSTGEPAQTPRQDTARIEVGDFRLAVQAPKGSQLLIGCKRQWKGILAGPRFDFSMTSKNARREFFVGRNTEELKAFRIRTRSAAQQFLLQLDGKLEETIHVLPKNAIMLMIRIAARDGTDALNVIGVRKGTHAVIAILYSKVRSKASLSEDLALIRSMEQQLGVLFIRK